MADQQHNGAAVRVCAIADIECSRGCGTGACKREQPAAAPIDDAEEMRNAAMRTVQAMGLVYTPGSDRWRSNEMYAPSLSDERAALAYALEAGNYTHSSSNTERHRSFKAGWKAAMEFAHAAFAPSPADERAARLDDAEIDTIAESMPGGLTGFMKQWGWRQFARAVEDEVILNVARAASANETGAEGAGTLAHEIWSAAQLAPGEGIEDGVQRIAVILSRSPAMAAQPARAWETDDGRVISDEQKQQALRDGGASKSSVRPFSIALGRIGAVPAMAAEAVAIPKRVSGVWPTDDMNRAGLKALAEFHHSRGDTVDAVFIAMCAAAPAQADARVGMTDEQREAIQRAIDYADMSDRDSDAEALRPLLATPLPEPRAEVTEEQPSLTNPLTPYGMLVRALRIVSGTTLMDMAKVLLTTPEKLSAMEFGRAPVKLDFALDVAAYFDALGVPDTLVAIRRAIDAACTGGA